MTTHDNLDAIGARVYGHESTAETDQHGGRIYGHNDDMSTRGARIYSGLGERGAVSHERPSDEHTTAVVGSSSSDSDDLDRIGARIAHGGGSAGSVSAENIYSGGAYSHYDASVYKDGQPRH